MNDQVDTPEALRIETAYLLLYTVLAELTVDLPDNVQDLEQGYRENVEGWELLKAGRPDLYVALVERATKRKADLRHRQHLTPASGERLLRPSVADQAGARLLTESAYGPTSRTGQDGDRDA